MNNEQQKALHDYQKASLEQNKDFKKKWIRRLFIILFIYGLLVLFTSIVGDYFYLPLPNRVDRYYDIRLNNRPFSVWAIRKKMIPIIPFVLYWRKDKEFSSNPPEELLYQEVVSEKYYLDVTAYSCYEDLSCVYNYNGKVKNHKKNISIKKMKIYKYKHYDATEDYIRIMKSSERYDLELRHELYNMEAYNAIYEGNYINNITRFLNEDSLYSIHLYTNEKTELTFKLVRKNNKIILL